MFKCGKKVLVNVLTVGCLLGGSLLSNAAVANAASVQGNSQPMLCFQTNMNGGLLNMWPQLGIPNNQQQGRQLGQQRGLNPGQQLGQQFGQQQGQRFGQQFGQQQGQQFSQQMGQQQGQQFSQQMGQQQGQQFSQQMGQRQGQQLSQQMGQQQGQQFSQKQDQQQFNIISQVASILDTDEQTIIDELQAGNTLAEIAESYDVSESTLLSELEDLQSNAIDDAVAAGTITETQATEMEDQLTERLTQLIESTFNNANSSLSAPDDLSATAKSTSKIYLEWDSVSNATTYYIYRATSYSGTYKKIDTVTTSSYTDTGLSDDTTYYYKIKAVNSSGTSAFSSIVHATTDED